MNQFERDLRESLRRREPPADFAAKVLARTSEPHVPRSFAWRWLTVAASVALMIGAMMLIQQQRRQAEGEKAKEQLMVAFRITGAKVRDIQARLDAIQQRVIDPRLNR
jgi:hypothetical protein